MLSGVEPREDDEEAESVRWHRFVSAFLTELPELTGSLADRELGPAVTPGDLWTTISLELLAEDYAPLRTQTDIWTRLLRLLEVAEELRALLEQATPESEADILTLDAFVRAGLLCDITRSRVGLELLLPWMGPRTVRAARGEAEAHHRVDRDWGGQDVDWDLAGTAFRPARLDPVNLWPD